MSTDRQRRLLKRWRAGKRAIKVSEFRELADIGLIGQGISSPHPGIFLAAPVLTEAGRKLLEARP